MSVVFKVIDQYHMRSECGRYYISRANGRKLTYTLWYDKKQLAQETCNDAVQERLDAVTVLKNIASKHFDNV